MKKLFIIIGVAALLATVSQAQTTTSTVSITPSSTTSAPTPPANAGSFLTSLQDYFTAFNTNLDATFGASKLSLWTGVDSIQGGDATLANEVGLSYNLWKALAPEAVIRNSGVASTLQSFQGGLGLNFVVHDVRLTLYGDGGDDLALPTSVNAKGKTVTHGQPFYGEIGLRAQKALTAHTYAWTGIGAQLPRNSQVFSAGIGITF